MSKLAIEFNDAGILAAKPGKILAEEPGYALVDQSGVLTGRAAYAKSRLQPSNVSTRHWAELSADASGARAANSAELAYEQLRRLWEQFSSATSEVLFVVPGAYDASQLGLLLGLAQECEIPVTSMVESSVAASTCEYPGRTLFSVDVSLHQISLTEIDQGKHASVKAHHSIESHGVIAFYDVVAKAIAERFVLSTRFDPLHRASTEQQLYDNLPAWLAALHQGNAVNAEISNEMEVLTALIEPQQVRGACVRFYRQIIGLITSNRPASGPVVVQLSSRLASLPGLITELGRLEDAEIVALSAGHAPFAALARVNGMARSAEGVRLLKRMPFSEQAAPYEARAVTPSAQPEKKKPTHIVFAGVAHGLQKGRIAVGSRANNNAPTIVIDDVAGLAEAHCVVQWQGSALRLQDLSGGRTSVNGRIVEESVELNIGDVIEIGSPSVQLHVVIVEAANGA